MTTTSIALIKKDIAYADATPGEGCYLRDASGSGYIYISAEI